MFEDSSLETGGLSDEAWEDSETEPSAASEEPLEVTSLEELGELELSVAADDSDGF